MRIHEDSPTDGDLVLVGKDKIGVRVHSLQLRTYRCVIVASLRGCA